MDIKALVVQQSEIKFNREEIEESLQRIEAKYLNLVFTEEELTVAKEERAKLNKLEKGLSTYRKDIVKEATAPIKSFEDFMKDSEKRAKKLSENIGDQIKAFEEKEKSLRLEKLKEYLEMRFKSNSGYKEFENMFVLSDSVYTNKGSYTVKGEVGTKLVEHISVIFRQIDEILEGRRVAEELLNQKRQLVINTCKSVGQLLKLEIPLDPKLFSHLKDCDLSEISQKIQEAGERAKEKEDLAIKKMQEEATRKAQEELDKKTEVKEEVKEVVQEVKVEEKPLEIPKEEVKILEEEKPKEKLFYANFSIDGIPVALAKELSAWLKENNVKYSVISQEVK